MAAARLRSTMLASMLLSSCLASYISQPAVRQQHQLCRRASIPAMSADTRLNAFHDWLKEHDLIDSAKVTGTRIEGFGVCLAAKEALQPGDAVLAVPRRLHLTAKRAEGTQLGEALEQLGVADESVVLAMVLLEQMALGEASQWVKYLELLPGSDDLSLPLLWSAEERAELLEGSHLLGCVEALLADLAQTWAAIEAKIVSPAPERYPPSVYRYEGFLWATAIVLSRALPFAGARPLCTRAARPKQTSAEALLLTRSAC